MADNNLRENKKEGIEQLPQIKQSEGKKVVLITGASSGIGLATAIYLLNKGFVVFGTSRKPDVEGFIKTMEDRFEHDHTKWKFTNKEKTELKATKLLIPKELRNNWRTLIKKIKFFQLDVKDSDSVANCIKKAWNEAQKINSSNEDEGGIDILINNAGYGYFGSLECLDLELQKDQFEVNLFGQIRVLKSILPLMRKRKRGFIINIASMAGITCIPFQTMYSASKSAVIMYSKGLLSELRPFNIKVSVVCPGDINTNFNAATVNIQQRNTNFDSLNIKALYENIPEKKESPYFSFAKKTWREIVKNLIVSPPPLVISKKIYKIIKSKKPRVFYLSGSLRQRIEMILVRRLISYDLAVKSTESFFGL
ncbi:MAG: SDR family NAD(P)-dependent oxidoreductase [Promethearchaeota archaeon]